jgi:CheY-like chemotaxis protein
MPLPDLGGQGVLRRLRAGGCSGTCIARPANAMPEDVARPRAAGFDDHRTRPIDFDRALATIDHLAAHAAATGSG